MIGGSDTSIPPGVQLLRPLAARYAVLAARYPVLVARYADLRVQQGITEFLISLEEVTDERA